MTERTITVGRQSESWVAGDNRLVEAMPRYVGEERIEDMETWAMAIAIEAACRDLSRQLTELFRQSPHDHHVKDGHFKVALETLHIHRHVTVELMLTVEEMEDYD